MPELVPAPRRPPRSFLVIGAVASVCVLGVALFGVRLMADHVVPQAPAWTPLPSVSHRPVANAGLGVVIDAPVEPGSWGYIPVKGVFVVAAPGDVRETSIGTLPEGSYVLVLEGPIPSSGEDWYRVAGDEVAGWIPAGRDGNAWVVNARTTATTVPGWDPPVLIPGAEVEYYDVEGVSPSELRDAVAMLGPVTDTDAEDGDVIAQTTFEPDFEEYRRIASFDNSIESYDACRVSWKFVVTLPRWIGPSPAPLPVFTWWEAARQKMVEHETKHVQIWRDALPALESRLDPIEKDAYCADAKSDVEQWATEVDPLQQALDDREGYLDWPLAP